MHKSYRKDISNEIDYTFLSFISSKLRVGVIGCGRAGTIKIKHFVNNNCYVEVISKEFNEEVIQLAATRKDKLKLIKEEFNCDFLLDKHIVIIALDDESIKEKIRDYCDRYYKIYIDSTDFIKGMGVIPVQRKTKMINIALNTKGGNPKGAVLAVNKAEEVLKEYDSFIEYTTKIRNNAKHILNYKKQILEVIGSKEFKDAFDEGSEVSILEKYFAREIVEILTK